MPNKNTGRIPLDNSGIIHLAVFPDGKPNLFRIILSLYEPVVPELLQEAVDNIAPRFPSIVAGIRGGFHCYFVVPAKNPPRVRKDREVFALMSKAELRECAMRILYGENTIVLECFHALTDGSGGFSFVNALAAEYLRLRHGEEYEEADMIITAQSPLEEHELEDSFLRHAGGKTQPLYNKPSYQLPGDNLINNRVYRTVGIFDSANVLAAAKAAGVSMAAFMTSVVASSVMEIQFKHLKAGEKPKSVQIMVPTDLRRRFDSKTLRNFTLYAMPSVDSSDLALPFPDLAKKISAQIKEQLSPESLRAMISSTAQLERNPFLKYLPLFLKCFILRMGYRVYGAKTSCFTMTNLGLPHFPQRTQKHLSRVDILLTPRLCSPYNFGVLSFKDKFYTCISRSSSEPEFENVFFEKLRSLGVHGRIEVS